MELEKPQFKQMTATSTEEERKENRDRIWKETLEYIEEKLHGQLGGVYVDRKKMLAYHAVKRHEYNCATCVDTKKCPQPYAKLVFNIEKNFRGRMCLEVRAEKCQYYFPPKKDDFEYNQR